jgi:hypothetical protein
VLSLKPFGTSLLIAGPSSSGKSAVVHAILERLIQSDYQVCLVDPEGDYDQVQRLITLGSSTRPPELSEILQVLQKPKTSVSVNLLGLKLEDRPSFFAALLAKILDLRAHTGRPHWLIVDEAHHLLPAISQPEAATLPEDFLGLILVTVGVKQIAPAALKPITGLIAVGPSPAATLHQFTRALPLPHRQDFPEVAPELGEVLVWFVSDAGGPIPVRVQPASSDLRGHQRKYSQADLGDDRSFFFRGPDAKLNLRAQNLAMFNQIAEGIDDQTWLFHLRQGDYSRWMRFAIKDQELADEVAAIETHSNGNPLDSRNKIIDAVKRRYTASA